MIDTYGYGDTWRVVSSTSYDWDTAYSCARAAALAYEERDVVAAQAEHWRIASTTLDREGTETVLLLGDEWAVLAFRGTEPGSLYDIRADVDMVLVPAPLGGLCHRGFLWALDAVWDALRARLAAIYTSGRALYVCGHSLGGALAILTAARLLGAGLAVWGCHTFGAPRVGDAEFARCLNVEAGDRVIRHVHNNDTITRLPPRLLGYRHAGRLIYYDERGDPQTDVGSWYRFCDRVRGRWEDFGEWGTDGVKDHAVQEYLRIVRQGRAYDQQVARRMR